MTSTNDITGDSITTGVVSDSYRDNWDGIFGKKPNESRQDSESSKEPSVGLEETGEQASGNG